MCHCKMCNHRLKKPESIKRGLGPNCQKKFEAMGSPDQTQLFESRLYKPEMSMIEKYRKAKEILYNWHYRAD